MNQHSSELLLHLSKSGFKIELVNVKENKKVSHSKYQIPVWVRLHNEASLILIASFHPALQAFWISLKLQEGKNNNKLSSLFVGEKCIELEKVFGDFFKTVQKIKLFIASLDFLISPTKPGSLRISLHRLLNLEMIEHYFELLLKFHSETAHPIMDWFAEY